MTEYNVQEASRKLLLEHLVADEQLDIPPEVKTACSKVTFSGSDPKPFLPIPFAMTESISAMAALVAASAAAVTAERYGIEQNASIDTDLASLFLMGFFIPNIGGISCARHEKMRDVNKIGDFSDWFKPMHAQSTNIYKCRDGAWYQLHASFDARPVLKALDVPDLDVGEDEATRMYADAVAKLNYQELDALMNDEIKFAGGTCYKSLDEYLNLPQGKALSSEPLVNITPISAPKRAWPKITSSEGYRPLAGIRVIDFARAVAAPTISKILAQLGADVIRISCNKLPDLVVALVDLSTGKRDVNIDLSTEKGKAQFREITAGADVLIDGYRPGVLERHGFNSKSLREVNPSLIYVRENCYGWKGPWAKRSGWQQIADAVTGMSWDQGRYFGLDEPVVPPLPNADYQTGVMTAAFVIHALMKRAKEDVTFDILVSLSQYNIWLSRWGKYGPAECEALRARNPGFQLRHFHTLMNMNPLLLGALQKSRPGLFDNPHYYTRISGKEWGVDEDITVLAPPFQLSKSTLGYLVPSGKPGWSNNDWKWR